MDWIMRWCVPDTALHVETAASRLAQFFRLGIIPYALMKELHPWL